jgi:hypothetical protein
MFYSIRPHEEIECIPGPVQRHIGVARIIMRWRAQTNELEGVECLINADGQFEFKSIFKHFQDLKS